MPTAASCRSGKRLGITRHNRPSVMPWHWSAGKSGSKSVFRCRMQTRTTLKSRSEYKIGCFQPCVIRPNTNTWTKSSLGRQRQPDREGGHCLRRALHPNLPVVQLNYLLADSQAQAGAGLTRLIGGLATKEAIEQMRQVAGGDNDRPVLETDLHAVHILARR